MKKLNININKTDILEKVSLNSSYAGAKSEMEKDIFDRVATIDDDNAILSEFWMEMCNRVTDKLSAFVKTSTPNDSSFDCMFELSGGYDDTLSPSVCEDIFSAIASGVTARWFGFTLPATAKDWEEKSEILLNRAISKICQRKRPERRG